MLKYVNTKNFQNGAASSDDDDRMSAVPPVNAGTPPIDDAAMLPAPELMLDSRCPLPIGASSSQFSKRAYFDLKRIFTSSTRPERCLATINSASPRISLPAPS